MINNIRETDTPNRSSLILIIKLIFFAFIIFVTLSCNKRVNNGNEELPPDDRISIPAFGTDSTLEVASWNIEQFPKMGNQTISDVAEIVKDLKIDLYAVEEITDVSGFQRLLDSLPGYNGKVATGANSFALWPAIIYDKSVISISNEQVLFTDDSYNFPRSPYSVFITYSDGQRNFDFTLIVLHLKAFGDATSVSRRKAAIVKLEQYISDEIQQGSDPDYIVAGDWNDELDDPPADNVFLPFLDIPREYTFLTLQFAGSSTEYTFIGGSFNSLIDHIMITAAIDTLYNKHTEILKIDQHFTSYLSEVSDHRPVAARFFIF